MIDFEGWSHRVDIARQVRRIDVRRLCYLAGGVDDGN